MAVIENGHKEGVFYGYSFYDLSTEENLTFQESFKAYKAYLNGELKGDPGPQGIEGPVGPEGPQGIQGIKGDSGAPAVLPDWFPVRFWTNTPQTPDQVKSYVLPGLGMTLMIRGGSGTSGENIEIGFKSSSVSYHYISIIKETFSTSGLASVATTQFEDITNLKKDIPIWLRSSGGSNPSTGDFFQIPATSTVVRFYITNSGNMQWEIQLRLPTKTAGYSGISIQAACVTQGLTKNNTWD